MAAFEKGDGLRGLTDYRKDLEGDVDSGVGGAASDCDRSRQNYPAVGLRKRSNQAM
jgi:hypothetical protein